MSDRKRRYSKKAAVKSAASAVSVQLLIEARNRVERLCGARVPSGDGTSMVPIDWIGTSAGSPPSRPLSGLVPPLFPPEQQAPIDLEHLGLSLDDIIECKNCGLWFLSASRRAEVCPKCRPRRWPTKYRRVHRATLNEMAGTKAKRARSSTA